MCTTTNRHNFPTIDKVENGVVTSVKSRDLGAKTYQNGVTDQLGKSKLEECSDWCDSNGAKFPGVGKGCQGNRRFKFVNAEEIVGRSSSGSIASNGIDKGFRNSRKIMVSGAVYYNQKYGFLIGAIGDVILLLQLKLWKQ